MSFNLKRIIGILGTLALLVLMWYVSNIVVYLLISIVISLVCAPLLHLLDKISIKNKPFPCWASAFVALVTVYIALISFLSIFTPVLAEEVRIIATLNMDDVYMAFSEPVRFLEQKAEEYNIQPDPSMPNREYVKTKVLGLMDLSQIPDFFAGLVSGLGNVLIAFFSISFISFFLMKDRWIVGGMIEALTPDKYMAQVKEVLSKSKKTLTRYFVGLIIQVSLITALLSITLSLFGVRNALVIGFFGGMINVIPYVGPLIGAAFGLVIGITTNLDTDTAMGLLSLQIAGTFLAVQMLDNFVFQPLIFSNSIDAHPLEIFLVIMIAGQLAGITGMVLAVPAYSFLRTVGAAFFSEFKLVKHLTKDI